MPSPIGHMLAGVATALASDIPRQKKDSDSDGRFFKSAALCASLAAAPDLDLLYPHIHRTMTHSVTAVAATFIIAAAVTGKVTRWRTATICALAWASHLLLDWLGTDWTPPRGVQLLWPFSREWFISGADVFRQTSMRHFFTWRIFVGNVLTIAQEVAILLPIVALLWFVRVKTAPRLAPELSGSHHAAQ
jgi:membrane-bound metal-dependent hydrolase YbcI (DUF457 family)